MQTHHAASRPLGRRTASDFRGGRAALLAAFLAAGGCGGGGVDSQSDSPDAASSPAADASPAGPGATFRITYNPATEGAPDSIFVETDCMPSWIRVFDADGNNVRIHNDCGACACDSCEPCAVCDCGFLAEEIPSAGSHDHVWDGIVHPTVTVAACPWACELDQPLDPGVYTARFCYSAEPGTGSVECSEEVFDHPHPTGVVEHVVDGSGL